MSTLSAAAEHLKLLQLDHSQDALYVTLGFKYGLGVDQISDLSGLPVATIRSILGGK